MLKQDTSIQSRGMMNEVARSVLSSQEVATFNYYVHQYEHYNLPVDDLVTPLLDLFNTKEKVHELEKCPSNNRLVFFLSLQIQLIAEVRTIIKPHDLQRYNELTVHKEIAAKKVSKHFILHTFRLLQIHSHLHTNLIIISQHSIFRLLKETSMDLLMTWSLNSLHSVHRNHPLL